MNGNPTDMNTQKLNELAAQVMGFSIAPSGDARTRVEWPKSDKVTFKTGWNPCEDLNDASALLEKVASRGAWSLTHNQGYAAAAGNGKDVLSADAGTAALAMTICALKVFGIPESSITEAMR